MAGKWDEPFGKENNFIRNDYDNKLTKEQKSHLTETDLDSYTNFDYIINNDEKLEDKIVKILSEVQYGKSSSY